MEETLKNHDVNSKTEQAITNIVRLVSIAEENIPEKDFAELDSAGVAAIAALKLQAKLEEELSRMQKEIKVCECEENSDRGVSPMQSGFIQGRLNTLKECMQNLQSVLSNGKDAAYMKAEKIPYEVIDRDTIWVAKMPGYRKIGTYDELKYCWMSEACRDIDVCAKQPDHLKSFYDAYFAYEEKHGFTTIKDFYNNQYAPSFNKEKNRDEKTTPAKKCQFANVEIEEQDR